MQMRKIMVIQILCVTWMEIDNAFLVAAFLLPRRIGSNRTSSLYNTICSVVDDAGDCAPSFLANNNNPQQLLVTSYNYWEFIVA